MEERKGVGVLLLVQQKIFGMHCTFQIALTLSLSPQQEVWRTTASFMRKGGLNSQITGRKQKWNMEASDSNNKVMFVEFKYAVPVLLTGSVDDHCWRQSEVDFDSWIFSSLCTAEVCSCMWSSLRLHWCHAEGPTNQNKRCFSVESALQEN